MLLASAGVPLGVAHGTTGGFFAAPLWTQLAAGLAALVLLTAGGLVVETPRTGKGLATLGILGTLALGARHLLASPVAALAALVLSTSALVLLWKIGAPLLEFSRVRRRPVLEGRAQGASLLAVPLWFLWLFTEADRSGVGLGAVGWAVAVSCLFGFAATATARGIPRLRAAAFRGVLLVAALVAPALWGKWWWLMSVFVAPSLAGALFLRDRSREDWESTSVWDPLLGHPDRLLVGTFGALCVGGTLLLALPESAAAGHSIGFVDAAFTATSAVCVTGLAVLDTPTAFSGFGKVALLVLIQLGGLGIMTFSTVALWALGRRMSLRHEGAVASLVSPKDRGRLFANASRVLAFTVITEALGALVLTFAFLRAGDGVGGALWRGVFTSISAFCNAGFALQTDSLIPYRHSPLVLHTVGVLIIAGGLSPAVAFALPALLRRSTMPVSAEVRLAVTTTAALLVGGFLFFLAFEWSDGLAGLGFLDKVHNAWFQSVTLRTAGFNSVDLGAVRPATVSLMLLWMFIGGNPGSTAGGVKTTTIAVLAASVLHAIRGQWTLEVYGKKIPERTRARATVVVAIAAASGLVALVALQLTQSMPLELALFEVVSALGTVGLTIGGTAELDGIGKGIIVACMFIGRIGGLTLLMFLSSRRAPATLGRPEEEINVG